MEVNFKLSDNQKYNAIFSLLNDTYDEEGNWIITYVICDVYDEYAVCYNYEHQQYERVYYTKDDSTDSLVLGEKVRCFIVDVTESELNALNALKELNGGNFELVNKKVTEYEQKIEELGNSVATLEQEKGEFSQKLEETAQTLETLQNENQALHSYKDEIEKAEKERVIDSYNNLLSDELLDSFKEKLDEYTAVELDKELAYALKQNNFSAFQKEESKVIPKDNPVTGIEAILSKY